MSPLYTSLYTSKEHLTLAQLLRAWARELGVDPRDLAEELLPDIGNRRRQLEGKPPLPRSDLLPLLWLSSLTRPSFEAKLVISREEALAVADQRNLAPPSWWAKPAPAVPAGGGPEGASPYRTGAPGRPTSMRLIEVEMKRRAAAGEMITTSMAAEARALVDGLKAKHPTAPCPTPKTVANKLGSMHRKLIAPSIPK